MKRKYPRPSSLSKVKRAAEVRNGGALPDNRVILKVKEKPDPNAPKPKSDYQLEKERQEQILNSAGDLHERMLADQLDINDIPF